MEIIKVYLKAVPDTAVEVRSFGVTDWYVKPKVLYSLAYKINLLTYGKCLYLTCRKYGCRQFTPYLFENFRIRNINFSEFMPELPWCVIEFGDKLENNDRI